MNCFFLQSKSLLTFLQSAFMYYCNYNISYTRLIVYICRFTYIMVVLHIKTSRFKLFYVNFLHMCDIAAITNLLNHCNPNLRYFLQHKESPTKLAGLSLLHIYISICLYIYIFTYLYVYLWLFFKKSSTSST